MRRMSDPGYVYRPLTQEQRRARSVGALIRIYGSLPKAREQRARKLAILLARRARLTKELSKVRAHIAHLRKPPP